MKKRYRKKQVIMIIKQHETRAEMDDICREMGISSGISYIWRSEYARAEVDEANRVK
jgi:putative transposase